MPLTAQSVVASARITLIDGSAVTFADNELLGYLNEGMQMTCFVKPDAYPVTYTATLDGGVIQTLPTDTNALLSVTRLVASGKGVRQIDRALLDAADPDWAARAQTAVIEHYMVDPRMPQIFWVFPPAVAGTQMQTVVGKRPPNMIAITDAIPMIETYVPALIEYVLYRAFDKNTKKQDLTKSAYHKQQWGTALGLKSQTQTTVLPRLEGAPT